MENSKVNILNKGTARLLENFMMFLSKHFKKIYLLHVSSNRTTLIFFYYFDLAAERAN